MKVISLAVAAVLYANCAHAGTALPAVGATAANVKPVSMGAVSSHAMMGNLFAKGKCPSQADLVGPQDIRIFKANMDNGRSVVIIFTPVFEQKKKDIGLDGVALLKSVRTDKVGMLIVEITEPHQLDYRRLEKLTLRFVGSNDEEVMVLSGNGKEFSTADGMLSVRMTPDKKAVVLSIGFGKVMGITAEEILPPAEDQ